MRIVSVAGRLLGLAAARLALGLACLGGSLAAGAEMRPASAAFLLGAAGSAALLISDRRSRFLDAPKVEPLPTDAVVGSLWHAVALGLWPSTIGVTVFALIALPADAVLAALLAGILGGMAVATAVGLVRVVLSERAERVRYYAELGGRRFFSSPR